MSEKLMTRSSDMGDENNINPITSVIIVADKNRCPRGFTPITKTFDEQNDADLWRESSFTFFSRPVRYLAISRDTPQNTVGTHVVTDLCVVKDSDPIPMGFIAIDYTADSKEKALRKKYLCVRTVARDAVVDAVGEIVLLSKMRKPPKNYSSAGEVDGVLICFKHIVIPSSFGVSIPRSRSTTSVLYPSVGTNEFRHSNPSLDKTKMTTITTSALTIKAGVKRGVEDVPFRLNPQVESTLARNKLEMLPELKKCDSEQLDRDYCYYFTLERAMLANP
uniref:MABP domain-containing protein n=1 Tax=Elaeophora elaphi TaxID=1147741 RepID=A0A0R3S298_9BILA